MNERTYDCNKSSLNCNDLIEVDLQDLCRTCGQLSEELISIFSQDNFIEKLDAYLPINVLF